jgi:hypothetical protein
MTTVAGGSAQPEVQRRREELTLDELAELRDEVARKLNRVHARRFKTGSTGAFGVFKAELAGGKRLQVIINAVVIGSRPEASDDDEAVAS